MGSAPSHDADVTARNAVYLCVGTSDFRQYRLRLTGWRDVVALGNHVKKVCPQPLQIDNLAPDLEFAFHQSVVAVEIHDELSIGAAHHGKISVTQVFIECHASTTRGSSRLSQSLQ